MVVVVLLGLAVTAVGVRWSGTTEAARLRAATLQLEQALRLARCRALAQRRPAWLQLQTGTGRYRVVTLAAGGGQEGIWHTLDGVVLARALAQGRPATSRSDGLFAVRVTPGGICLPWAAELRAGTRLRVVWTDGLAGRLSWRDGADAPELGREFGSD